MNSIDIDCFLVVGATIRGEGRSAWGVGKPSVRVAKSKPSIRGNEVPIAISLRLPVSLFQKPSLSAKIVVPEEKVPFEITPDVIENIAEAMRASTGFAVELEVKAPVLAPTTDGVREALSPTPTTKR